IGGILIAPHIKARHGMLGTTFGGNHLACAAALAVLEVMEAENLMAHAATEGQFLLTELAKFPELQQVRGRGLMIGFDVPASLADLRSRLLHQQHIFTGEAKPHVIRLLPALNLHRAHSLRFLQSLQLSLDQLKKEMV
ncbi:MAG: aminotransferase class III-fold pyridoxal phosphate-dependent enzyme, partial [Sphingobacteriia bacterium]